MSRLAIEKQKREVESKSVAEDGKPIRRRVTRSKLRKTQAKLHEIEDKALENIKKSVEGSKVDKEVVNTSKWVVQQVVSIAKAAAQDEADLNGLRFKAISIEQEEAEALQQQEEEVEEPKPRFSLHVLPTKKDLE